MSTYHFIMLIRFSATSDLLRIPQNLSHLLLSQPNAWSCITKKFEHSIIQHCRLGVKMNRDIYTTMFE